MPHFGNRSLRLLSQCHWDLQRLAQDAIQEIDFAIICGFRDKKAQTIVFLSGASKLEFPNSQHNKFPAQAFDFLPWPFESWKDMERFKAVANVLKAKAARLEIKIICGVLDWEWDFAHVELK